jgi:competence protein ComEC
MALQQFGYGATQPIVISLSCPETVTAYFFDVGQGDSILIKTPTKNVLIDGGPAGASSKLLNYLNTYNVSKIDLLFVTHPEDDHIGGLPAVMQAVTVTDIIYNGDNETTQTFNSFMSLASTHNLTIACRNQIYSLSSTINFTVLNPTQPLEFSETPTALPSNSKSAIPLFS